MLQQYKMADFCYKVISSFDDERLSAVSWNNLLTKGSSDVIFMTWQWQKVWWEVFGRGKLLIIIAEQEGELIAIAPLFTDGGMIYFVGSGGSDYLDFIGDLSNINVLENLLDLARKEVPDFLGYLFYHIPETSQTHALLDTLAINQELYCCDEGELPAPAMELKKFPEQTLLATMKKSLMRHEAWFRNNGGIDICHLIDAPDILPHLQEFFDQHISRWEPTPFPSLFLQPNQCEFFSKLTTAMSDTGWLRFTYIKWENKTIAFHFGFNYKGSFLWYKPSFDIELSKNSPGELLLRQLLLQAIKEEADIFDFGLGDEAFKKRFATSTLMVRNIGLYPSSIKENNI